jgi:hypothetical protein
MSAPAIVIERREIILRQVPGVGPPGSVEGGFSVNGEPPFDMSGSIEGLNGIAVVSQGLMPLYMPRPGTLAYVLFGAGIAPQGQSLLFDVNKNGTSLWDNDIDKPSIAPGMNVSLKVVPDHLDFLAGDYFTVDIDQIGTTSAGGMITFSIWYF